MALFEMRSRQREALDAVSRHARSLAGAAADDAELMRLLAGADFALLGEASHGSDEFYRERAAITRRLIVERGIVAVAVEADWPDALPGQPLRPRPARRCRWRRGARPAFGAFRPGCGATRAVLEFVEWLRGHNARAAAGSARRLLRPRPLQPVHLDRRRARLPRSRPTRRRPGAPGAATPASSAYREDAQAYGYATRFGIDAELRGRGRRAAAASCSPGGAAQAALEADGDDDACFHAEQNARLVKNAEGYYRTMFGSRVASWNLRDRHMVETLEPCATISAPARPRRRGSPSGRTTRTSAMPAPPRWAKPAS